MHEKIKLDETVEFAELQSHTALVYYILDTSGSMHGTPIKELNEGLHSFKEDLINNSLASRRVEVPAITFDYNVKIVQGFVTADQFKPLMLTAQGPTHTGAAIHKALDTIQSRKV